MTRAQACSLLSKLTKQLDTGFARIVELEAEGLNGLPHTCVREQINATYQTILALRDELPVPFYHSDFNHFLEIMQKWSPNHRFGWWGWM